MVIYFITEVVEESAKTPAENIQLVNGEKDRATF